MAEKEISQAITRCAADSLDLPADSFMNAKPARCTPGDDLRSVMSTLTHRRARHVLVVKGAQLRAIMSVVDIVKSRLSELELEVNVLRDMARCRSVIRA